jgi:hypothetical protein
MRAEFAHRAKLAVTVIAPDIDAAGSLHDSPTVAPKAPGEVCHACQAKLERGALQHFAQADIWHQPLDLIVTQGAGAENAAERIECASSLDQGFHPVLATAIAEAVAATSDDYECLAVRTHAAPLGLISIIHPM